VLFFEADRDLPRLQVFHDAPSADGTTMSVSAAASIAGKNHRKREARSQREDCAGFAGNLAIAAK
jgi:hypothetical protein